MNRSQRIRRLLFGWVVSCAILFLADTARAQDDELRANLSNAIFDGDVTETLRLAKKLPDINQGTEEWDPPLFEAVAWSELEIVKELVQMGASVDVKNDLWGMPVINEAAGIGDKEVFDFLLSKGAKVDQLDKYGGNALEEAAFSGNVEIARILVKRGLKSKFPLHLAAGLGDLETVKKLIAEGADVNELTQWKNSPLLFAAGADNEETLGLLLKANAETEVKNVSGVTAMHFAAASEKTQLVEALLKAGANVNALSPDKETPLDWCFDERVEKVLTRAGAKHGPAYTP